MLCLFIADRHFSSEQGLSETGSRVELGLKHALAVLVAVSWTGTGTRCNAAAPLFSRH